MPDLQEAITQFADSIIRSERQGHAAMVMRITSILEYDLERSIKWEFRMCNPAGELTLGDGFRPVPTFLLKYIWALSVPLLFSPVGG
jgi:hypothetical protein